MPGLSSANLLIFNAGNFRTLLLISQPIR